MCLYTRLNGGRGFTGTMSTVGLENTPVDKNIKSSGYGGPALTVPPVTATDVSHSIRLSVGTGHTQTIDGDRYKYLGGVFYPL